MTSPMLSSPGVSSPRTELFSPHHGGFYVLGTPAAPACARGRGEVGRTPFVSFPLSRCCVSQPLLRFLPSKKVSDTRYHLCEVWTESQTGISLHHYRNSASRRKAVTRKKNTHLLPQSASLLPSPLNSSQENLPIASHFLNLSTTLSPPWASPWHRTLSDALFSFTFWVRHPSGTFPWFCFSLSGSTLLRQCH